MSEPTFTREEFDRLMAEYGIAMQTAALMSISPAPDARVRYHEAIDRAVSARRALEQAVFG